MKTIFRSLTLAAALLGGAAAANAEEKASSWKQGQAAPSLSGYGLAGSLPATKGKVVYLDFWASWCGPCKKSFPVLEKWHKAYAGKGLVVLGVSVDEDKAAMEAFLKKQGVTFPNVHDAAQKLVAAADAATMPTSIIIDRKGAIHLVHKGFKPADEAELTKKIEALLAAK
jgi:thiol-disulfide isomerase/thioredoxin